MPAPTERPRGAGEKKRRALRGVDKKWRHPRTQWETFRIMAQVKTRGSRSGKPQRWHSRRAGAAARCEADRTRQAKERRHRLLRIKK